jgi:hypothetical protein
MRLCSGPCKTLKPKTEFNVKNKQKGWLTAWCKVCIRQYQQARYLSSAKLEKYGPVLRFILEEGDEHAGVICADCQQPCRAGDEVVASDAVLRHAVHHSK